MDDKNDVGLYTSIALDSSNQPHISYYDATIADLRFAQKVSGQWVNQAVDVTGKVGRYTSLVLDSSGVPLIAYYDETNGDLKLASGYIADKKLFLPLQPDS